MHETSENRLKTFLRILNHCLEISYFISPLDALRISALVNRFYGDFYFENTKELVEYLNEIVFFFQHVDMDMMWDSKINKDSTIYKHAMAIEDYEPLIDLVSGFEDSPGLRILFVCLLEIDFEDKITDLSKNNFKHFHVKKCKQHINDWFNRNKCFSPKKYSRK